MHFFYNFCFSLLLSSFSLIILGQQDADPQQLPPFDQLPKIGETKTFVEFDGEYPYEVFDTSGVLLEQNIGQFIDVTKYKIGSYYVVCNGDRVNTVWPDSLGGDKLETPRGKVLREEKK
ncbi:MAG: hypothetical protein ACI9RU_001726 [Litorivivens sp.]|jgi:hypothetical protein